MGVVSGLDEYIGIHRRGVAGHIEFVEKTLQQLRDDDVYSRTLRGRLDRGWVRWSAERRVQQRHLVRDLWEVALKVVTGARS